MDITRGRRTGNPLVGRAAVEAPLLSPVLSLVPVSAGSACPRARGGLTEAPAALWVLLPLVLWVLLTLVERRFSVGRAKLCA